MNRYEDANTSPMTFLEVAAQSSALQEAEMLAFDRSRRRGLPALLDGSRRERREYEHTMATAWHKNEQVSLQMTLTSRQIALREQHNHWLYQGVTSLRRQTAESSMREHVALSRTLAEHCDASMQLASDMLEKAERFAHQPMLREHYQRMAVRYIEESDLYSSRLMRLFTNALNESL